MKILAAISSPAQDDVIERILRARGEWDLPWPRSHPARGLPASGHPPCHRTGLARGDLLFVKGDIDRDEILRRVRLLGQTAPFRSLLTYSSVLYALLGEVVRAAGGMPWERFVARRILEPPELQSTPARG